MGRCHILSEGFTLEEPAPYIIAIPQILHVYTQNCDNLLIGGRQYMVLIKSLLSAPELKVRNSSLMTSVICFAYMAPVCGDEMVDATSCMKAEGIR